MINIRITTLIILCVAIFSTGTGIAAEDHERAKQLKEAGDILPLEEIIKKVAKQYPGRILETELEEEDDRKIYEIEILDDKGIVWKLKFDARTGGLIKRKEDR